MRWPLGAATALLAKLGGVVRGGGVVLGGGVVEGGEAVKMSLERRPEFWGHAKSQPA